MSNSHFFKQKTAGIIQYSCGVLFMLFTFSYLYFLQGDLLAEAQFVYSHGATTYNLFIGAIIITAVLQILQRVVHLLTNLPPRWYAFSYLPSMLGLAILTDIDRHALLHFTFGAWVWMAPLILVGFVIAVFLIRHFNTYFPNESTDLKSQAYPNFIILFVLILVTGAIPHNPDVFHYEMKTERLILGHDYEAASHVGERSLRSTARLTQLRMYALSQQGLLAERLFDYPQYYGSQGLLDIAESQPYYRFTTQDICTHLGARCGKTVSSTQRYYHLLLNDSLCNVHTIDYYLCSLLLDKRTDEFLQQFPCYYHLGTSHNGDNLPRAYREALLLLGDPQAASSGVVRVKGDTLAVFTDNDFIARYRDYKELKSEFSDRTERVNKTHREFGNTYWWYYDCSHLATGELQRQ